MKQVNCTFVDFGILPAPAVRASFYIPRIKYECPTTFIIDTGSDSTCLHGQMAYKLQKRMIKSNLDEAIGVGGPQQYFFEKDSIIIFRDSEQIPFETINHITLGIQLISDEDAQDGEILSLPSVLGRDIISKGEFIYDIPTGRMSLCFPDINTKRATIAPS